MGSVPFDPDFMLDKKAPVTSFITCGQLSLLQGAFSALSLHRKSGSKLSTHSSPFLLLVSAQFYGLMGTVT